MDKKEPEYAHSKPLTEVAPNDYLAKSPFPRTIRDGSENIDASIQGNTPCKPDIDASATKQKQLKFLQ